jgi:hypothetical protein
MGVAEVSVGGVPSIVTQSIAIYLSAPQDKIAHFFHLLQPPTEFFTILIIQNEKVTCIDP